jgi:hypothetical protein
LSPDGRASAEDFGDMPRMQKKGERVPAGLSRLLTQR